MSDDIRPRKRRPKIQKTAKSDRQAVSNAPAAAIDGAPAPHGGKHHNEQIVSEEAIASSSLSAGVKRAAEAARAGSAATDQDLWPDTDDMLMSEPDGPAVTETSLPKKHRFSKRQRILAIIAAILLIGGSATSYALLHRPDPVPAAATIRRPAAKPKPTTVASSLTGRQVDPSVNQRPVIGVMIENSVEARPQSGLDEAGVVFEAIAEGGITRFLALYQDTQPDYVGPVRSVRPYYLQWCMSFDCSLAHAGGSPEALGNIRQWGAKDLDQFANDKPYQRIRSRYSPHNLYTSVPKLTDLAEAKGYKTVSFAPLARKADSRSQTPNATTISLAVSSAKYNSSFTYDAAANSYLRSQGGSEHTVIDSSGANSRIKPKVVVALIMPYGVAADGHSQYSTVGSGQAVVFQDGTATAAAWHKDSAGGALSLTDAAGAPLALNAGQTWFTVLSGQHLATYK